MLLPGAVLLGVALFKARRGWRLEDMRKGARAEESVGQAIEYALTSKRCAAAHHVEGIARIGDIDHLVATPRGLWVIETKHGRPFRRGSSRRRCGASPPMWRPSGTGRRAWR